MHRPKWGSVLLFLCVAASCANEHAEKGDALAQQHRWTEALAEYHKALARYPRDFAAAWGDVGGIVRGRIPAGLEGGASAPA